MPTILPWPAAILPHQLTLHLQAHTSRFESPFTRATQTQQLPGGRFRLAASFAPALKASETRLLRAFAAKLRGSAGRFYFGAEVGGSAVPAAGAADIALSGLTADNAILTADREDYSADATQWYSSVRALVLAGGSATAIVASADHQIPGTVAIEAGRHLSFDTSDGWRQLCVVTDDAVVATNGRITINVEPPIRVQPAVGAPLHLRAPSGVFALADDDQLQISLTPGIFGQASLDAIEALPLRLTP